MNQNTLERNLTLRASALESLVANAALAHTVILAICLTIGFANNALAQDRPLEAAALTPEILQIDSLSQFHRHLAHNALLAFSSEAPVDSQFVPAGLVWQKSLRSDIPISLYHSNDSYVKTKE